MEAPFALIAQLFDVEALVLQQQELAFVGPAQEDGSGAQADLHIMVPVYDSLGPDPLRR